MTRFAATDLATVHLALSVVAVLWNIAMAGRIARMPDTPYAMGALSAVGGLVIAPALFVVIASASLLSGRALHTIAWLWPATALLMTVQAGIAVMRGRAAVPLAAPILVYNALLAIVYGTRYLVQRGVDPPDALMALSAAQTSALALGTQPMVLLEPYYLHVPLLAPASPGRRGRGTLARSVAAALAAVWLTVILLKVPEGARAIASYDQLGGERLHERPDDGFSIGLKILPTLTAGPPPLALQSDLAMIDTTGVDVMSVYLSPGGTGAAALEDLASGLDARRSGRTLIIALDLSRADADARRDPARYLQTRAQALELVAGVLRPEYVVPVLDPYGSAARRLGTLPESTWRDYFSAARSAIRRGHSGARLLVHVGGYTAADSSLYAWAAGEASPADAVGLSVFPGYLGGSRLDARMSVAARWIRAMPTSVDHWVLEGGALPVAHGDENQTRALWAALAWATSQPQIRGFVVHQASDYESPTGLRAPGGRIRPAAYRLAEAVRTFAEAAVPEAAP